VTALKPPSTLRHYLQTRLAALAPEARLVFLLDPPARLELEPSLQVHGKSWPVVRYRGDDLAFRAAFDPARPALIWVTLPVSRTRRDASVCLSSLADLLSRADAVFDLSLEGVLAALIPGEVWPRGALEAHATIFAAHLHELVAGYRALHKALAPPAPLDATMVRALALHCLQPQLAPAELLFRQDSPRGVLEQYLNLAWSAPWTPEGLALLQEQARHGPRVDVAEIAPWLDAPPEAIARYLYLYRLLSSTGLPNVNNQLRGLALLPFDPQPMEAHISIALDHWERDTRWRNRVIEQAEMGLTRADVARAVDLLDIGDVDRLLSAIAVAEAPAAIVELAGRLVPMARESRSLRAATIGWEKSRPAGIETMPQTPYTKQAEAIVRILDQAALIARTVTAGVPTFPGLPEAIDWYTASGAAALELAHSRALAALRSLPDDTHRGPLQRYVDYLGQQVREFLDQADHALARLIQDDFAGYLSSPRLSTRLVRDAIRRRQLKATTESCLWIVILDGMRWDTWIHVVRPRLLEAFELLEEGAYLCLLPSLTQIARTGLLAGQTPPHWKAYRGGFSTNQHWLAGRLLDVPEDELQSRLRFYSRMDEDEVFRDLEPRRRFPYNVLIFNVSDNNLHHLRGGLDAVSQVVADLLGSILDLLNSLVGPSDTVILASDHGFTELDRDAACMVPDDTRWRRYIEGGRHPVAYRHIAGVDPPAGLTDALSFAYSGVPEGRYTVAIGRRWFQRADSRGEMPRYAHGGLSFAEMVVPGAVLRRATTERLELSLEGLPASLTTIEGQETTFSVTLTNTGNRAACFALSYRADTDARDRTARGRLNPGERISVPISLVPVYRARGGSTRALHLQLAYGQSEDSLTTTLPRTVPVTVSPQKGKIEISFGGLDRLDQ